MIGDGRVAHRGFRLEGNLEVLLTENVRFEYTLAVWLTEAFRLECALAVSLAELSWL